MPPYSIEDRNLCIDGVPTLKISIIADENSKRAMEPVAADSLIRRIGYCLNAHHPAAVSDLEMERRRDLRVSKAASKEAQRHYLAALLAQIRPTIRPMYAAVDAAQLEKFGRTYSKVKVSECNREISPAEERKRDKARRFAMRVAAFYGLEIDDSGDGLGLVLTGADLFPFTSGTTIGLGN